MRNVLAHLGVKAPHTGKPFSEAKAADLRAQIAGKVMAVDEAEQGGGGGDEGGAL